MEPWFLAQQEQGHPPPLPMGVKHLFPPTMKLLLSEEFIFPPLLFLLMSQTRHQRRMLWVSRTLLEVQCLRKTFPRAGPLGELSAKEMGFQHIFAPLSSAKHRHEAAQHLTCGGLMGYLALSNTKIQAPKAITSLGASIQACNQEQKLQRGGDSSAPLAYLQVTELLADTRKLSQAFFLSWRLAEPSLLSPAFLGN